MNFLARGQFRRIRFIDQESAVYQCLWCKRTTTTSDNPDYWNFCHFCGKSWFTRLQCRDHDVPRWFYDRWGNAGTLDHIRLFPKVPRGHYREVSVRDLLHWAHISLSRSDWVIECRTYRTNTGWSEWSEEASWGKDPNKSDYMWAYQKLQAARKRWDYSELDGVKMEFHIKLVRRLDLLRR